MNDPLQKLFRENWADILSVIFSQELEDGATLCNLLNGRKTDLSGQGAVRASPSLPPGNRKGKRTNGTCGQCGSSLSVGPDRQLCLENKCQPLYTMVGGTMWPMIWKEKVTPRGRKLGQLAVSVRPIDVTDCGLWPTITAADAIKGGSVSPRLGAMGLSETAGLWSTPNTMDHLTDRSPQAMDRQFSTTRKGRTAPANLREQVNPAMWPTPREFMHKDAKTDRGKGNLGEIVNGMGNGSTAPTENKGSLNPQFVCWLIGLPIVWENCGDMVTPLSRKSQQSSSKRTKDKS